MHTAQFVVLLTLACDLSLLVHSAVEIIALEWCMRHDRNLLGFSTTHELSPSSACNMLHSSLRNAFTYLLSSLALSCNVQGQQISTTLVGLSILGPLTLFVIFWLCSIVCKFSVCCHTFVSIHRLPLTKFVCYQTFLPSIISKPSMIV